MEKEELIAAIGSVVKSLESEYMLEYGSAESRMIMQVKEAFELLAKRLVEGIPDQED